MRVMLATDGSTGARAATAWLASLPLPADTSVSVVAVAGAPEASVTPPPLPGGLEALAGHLRHAAGAAVKMLGTRWPTAELRVPAGDPRVVLPECAGARDADLLVVGAHGLGAGGSVMAGSVSTAVVRAAPCSVLVVHGVPRPLRRVVIAVDGSEPSLAAARFVATLSLESRMAVRLVGVVQPPKFPMLTDEPAAAVLADAVVSIMDDEHRRLETALAQAADEFRGPPVTIERVIATGSPADEILAAVEQFGADLVATGARGLGPLKRLLLGSVSERVLRRARVPVLVVKP